MGEPHIQQLVRQLQLDLGRGTIVHLVDLCSRKL